MTRGRAATPDPFDIGAVNRSGELFDALAARRLAEPGDDPAVRLLAALTADVDVGAPPLPAPARMACGKSGSRRRVVRTVVTLGVTAAVLTTAGAAAAGGGGGGGGDRGADGARAPHVNFSERTRGSLQVSSPERFIGRSLTPPVPRKRRGGEDHRTRKPGSEQRHPSRHQHDSAEQSATPELQDSATDPATDSGGNEQNAITPTVTPSPGPTVSPPTAGVKQP